MDVLPWIGIAGGEVCRENVLPFRRRQTRPDRVLFTFPSFFPQGGLDRIYHRGGIDLVAVKRCPLLLSKVASDHLPVVADFEVA